jgi:hypothetical protein
MPDTPSPAAILEGIYARANASLEETVIPVKTIRDRIDYVVRCVANRAGVRLLM